MMIKKFFVLLSRSSAARSLLSRVMFRNMTRAMKNSPVLFLSYGYVDIRPNAKWIELQEIDEADRICIQLYHHVASRVDLNGLDVLEVSCGHGGGASYVMRYLQPKSMMGVDRNPNAIDFCNHHYSIPDLSFSVGEAEDLQFEENSFDAIVNVEASHFYAMDRFLDEVVRVLRPNGHLLFADIRNVEDNTVLHEQMVQSDLEIIEKEDISSNVLKAMELAGDLREELTIRFSPRSLHYFVRQFTGGKGSQIDELRKSREMVYLRYILRNSNGHI
jgi:ubiquinone/menaquinone biosynthesis C-methylase UbiE